MTRKIAALSILLLAAACSDGTSPTSPGGFGPEPGAATSAGDVRAAITPANCTYSQGFWKNHADDWPLDALVLGGASVTSADALALLRTPPRGDATIILAHQLIAARLNEATGADTSAVASVLADADAFLAANPIGSKPGAGARQTGAALATTLDAFNNGLIGPGHCGDTPIPEPTPEPTPGEESRAGA